MSRPTLNSEVLQVKNKSHFSRVKVFQHQKEVFTHWIPLILFSALALALAFYEITSTQGF